MMLPDGGDEHVGSAWCGPARAGVGSAFDSVRLAWPAAGSARAAQHGLGRTVDSWLAAGAGSEGCRNLADVAPIVYPEPAYGRAIDAALSGPPPAAAPPPDLEPDRIGRAGRAGRRPTPEAVPLARGWSTPPPSRPGDGSSPEASPVRPGQIGSRPGQPGPPPPRRSAMEPDRLPATMADDRLAARAGGRFPPKRPTEQAAIDRPAAPQPATRWMPAGPSPIEPSEPPPGPAPLRPRFDATPDGLAEWARTRLARRLGLADGADLGPALGVVPGTGIRAGIDLLARCLDRTVGTGSPSAAASDGWRSSADPPVAPTAGPDRQRGVPDDPAGRASGEPGSSPARAQPPSPGPSPARAQPPSPGPSAARAQPQSPGSSPISSDEPVEHGEATPLRRVGRHDEMPPLPERERSTAPVVGAGPDDRSLFSPLADRLASPGADGSAVIDRHELEQQMKSILDEAARRHGIEL